MACRDWGNWFIFESRRPNSSMYCDKKKVTLSSFWIFWNLSRKRYDEVS